MSAADTRAAQRAAALSRRRAMSPDARRRAGLGIAERLRALDVFQSAAGIALYRAMPGEPDLNDVAREMQRAGRRVLVPGFDVAAGVYRFVAWPDGEAWIAGPDGVPQPAVSIPAELRAGEIVIVPGVAFDRAGHRLGHGQGHYDRLLADRIGIRIGVAFECQIEPEIPERDGDVPMDWVVTEQAATRIVNLNKPTMRKG